MKTTTTYGLALAAAVAAVLVGAGLSWWYGQRADVPNDVPPAVVAVPPPASAPASAPGIQHPIESVLKDAPPGPLPPLAQSDGALGDALTALLGRKAVLTHLQVDNFVHRFVATVDNLARAQASPRLWPVNPTGDRFAVEERDGQTVMATDNGLRYAPLVLLAESIDPEKAVELYARFYPLFQQAYEELGYPKQYFNDRLVHVIDHLLATPEPQGPVVVKLIEVPGPIKMERPWVNYQYADPELEALTAGQKALLRTGPANERRLKARLLAFRQAITGEVAPR
jgi:hypothetical protein